MNIGISKGLKGALLAGLCIAPTLGFAFDSGSTGADGAFSPTVNTKLELPPSGVFNFTTVNIPAGVNVTFKKNASNTPVVWLASGNVTIAGNIYLNGANSTNVGAAGDGNIGDDGQPGVGGPGGYDGGRGGEAGSNRVGGYGLGPGGGCGGTVANSSISYWNVGGAGGGFGTGGSYNYALNNWGTDKNVSYGILSYGGPSYGSGLLLPLVGGSGGGGGAGGTTFSGSGGSGGGGAILIASSGTVNVSGTINANGATGGGGSGGAIRIVATTIAGNGTISANAVGAQTNVPDSRSRGGAGGSGRIRLEAESITRTAATTPAFTTGAPGPLFISGAPSLTISSVAGVAAPASPTGNADITLPETTPNPVTVVLTTTGVPPGNTVKLTVTPANAAAISVTSPALTGSTESATASVSITLPTGPSVMSAMTTYTVVASVGDAMSIYAQGERVEQVRLSAVLGRESMATLITVSGKEYEVPASRLVQFLG
jgi:hypothetical protein